MCLLDSDRTSQHANKSAGSRWRNRIGLITDFTAQSLWLFRVRCLVYSYFLPFFSRSIRRILHHGLQDLYVIFCRKNGSECSFSRSYSQDISCWRFEVVFVEFIIWMNVLFSTSTLSISYLYNNPSHSRILIGSRLWSIRGQTHRWRQRSIPIVLIFFNLNQSQFFAKHSNHSVRFILYRH